LTQRALDVDWLQSAEFFFRWWLHELSYFVPPRWREIFARDEVPVLAVRRAERTETANSSQSHEVCVPLSADRQEGLLLLGPGTFYVHRVELPSLSTKNLAQAVHFEALRCNPLVRNLSCLDYRVAGRDYLKRCIHVDLFVVRQRTLDYALDNARSLGITLVGACVDGGDADTWLPRLLRPKRRLGVLSVRQRRVVRTALVRSAGAAALTILIAIRLHIAEANAQAKLAHLETIVRANEPQRLRLQMLGKEIEALNSLRQGTKTFAELAKLTHLLPDSVWLNQFTTTEDGAHIQGVAQKASSLIEMLSASPMFTKVSFSGPIIRDNSQNLEQFSLDLDMK